MSGSHRRVEGGAIDRSRPVAFTFDGRGYIGFAGDTLASALLANGVRLFGRSFKYHRPRGVLSAGIEEPNALVGVGEDRRFEPNTRATDLYLYDGLAAVSQNRWPSLAFDLGAVNRLIARFIPAGFYYKTFFGGPHLWLFYERFIRKAAGLGAAPKTADADLFEHRAAFCDVLVVGSGPAGLAAAKAASEAGARVILAEQDSRLGGSLLRDTATIDGQDALAWADGVAAAVKAAGGRVLARTTAVGAWDHGMVTLAERIVEAGQAPIGDAPAQRLWRVRARRVVLATGAIERPLLFAGNDSPGVMLSSSVRTYVERFAVLPGRRVAVAACNDDAYLTALSIHETGGDVAAVLDSRPTADSEIVCRVKSSIPVHFDAAPVKALVGKGGVTGLEAVIAGKPTRLACDLIAVSGGFTPVVHLHMQAGGALEWDDANGAFIPGAARQNQISAGAAAGADGLEAHLKGGHAAGVASAALAGFDQADDRPPPSAVTLEASGAGAAYDPAPGVHLKTAFVDYQNDVTAADLDLAWREGYRSVEHLKRYTTLGMATDQGKTSNLLGLARLAKAEGRPMPQVGLTTFRPPYTPVTLGVLAGEAVGEHVAPQRRLKLHDLHAARAPLWQPSGYWSRPRAFPRAGESLNDAALREARTVRTTVGLTDVSTLAKFEIAGPDAAAILEIVCATTVGKLAVGRGRYTFMLREDGFVVDDGTVWRLDDQRFPADQLHRRRRPNGRAPLLCPQNPGAAAEDRRLERTGALVRRRPGRPPRPRGFGRPCWTLSRPATCRPPRARSPACRFRCWRRAIAANAPFEIYAISNEMALVWTALSQAVETAEGALYGLEALELLRIEKGHIEVGAEIDGRRTPADLGLQKMLNPRGGYVGAQGLTRPALRADGRQTFVGLEADTAIPEGAMLILHDGAAPEGHVSSAGRRLDGDGGVALGLLRNGGERLGETLLATSPTRGKTVTVRVAEPHFHDPAGARYRD